MKNCDMLDNHAWSEKSSKKKNIMHGVWYEIIASVYDYIKLYRYTINIIEQK